MSLRILIAAFFLFSTLGWSAPKSTTPHLRDYVLTANQIQRLTAKDQASYLAFLYHLIATIEVSQAKDRPMKTTALLEMLKRLPFDMHFFKEAFAAGGSSFPIFGRNIATKSTDSAYIKGLDQTLTNYTYLVTPEYPNHLSPDTDSRHPASDGEMVGGVRLNGPAENATAEEMAASPPPRPQREFKRPMSPPPLVKPPEPKATPPAPEEPWVAAPPPPPPPPPAEMLKSSTPKPTAVSTTATGYKKIGASCLFGGYVSHYVEKNNGALSCPRPKGTINSGTCLGTPSTPKFKCNNFGMETGPAQANLQTTTCIPLKPLTDLTIRCVNAINSWFESTPPTSMDGAAYSEWRKQVIAQLDTFEIDFGNGIAFSDYCANKNAVNERRQAAECGAITTLISQLKSTAGAVSQLVAKNSAQEDDGEWHAAPPPIAPAKNGDQ